MSAPRVAFVHPVPMPYMFPVLRLVAASGEAELTVLYSRRSLAARGEAPDPAGFGFPHVFLADAGRVFVGREVREIDLNPGLPRALDRLGADVVVVSGFVQPTALLGVAWAWLRRRPYGVLVESHDARRRGRVRTLLRRATAGPIVRRAGVLYPSGDAAARSLAHLGAGDARMTPFPHVPDPALFHPADRAGARASLGLDDGAPLLAFVGRLVESKGVATLLEAHREVHRRTGARLAIGGTGPLHDSLAAAGVPGVTFLGQLGRAEVATLLRAADVAVAPSLDEPWGTFALEAAACGCAVVASDRVPSAVELARHHDAARLVPPSDPGALAGAVLGLLDSPAELEALARRGVEAAAGYTPDRVAESFLRGIRIALGGGS